MQATTTLKARNPGFAPQDSAIFADWCEENGMVAEAWVLRHDGKLARSQKPVKAICEAVVYQGRKIKMEAVDGGETQRIHSNSWDEGSRSYWWYVRLNGGKVAQVTKFADSGNPWTRQTEEARVMDDGFVLVENIIFCGKDCELRVYGTPATLHQLFSK